MYLFICHEVMQHFRVFQSKFFWITCLYIIWYGRESYSMWTILKVFRMSYLYFKNIHLCVDLHILFIFNTLSKTCFLLHRFLLQVVGICPNSAHRLHTNSPQKSRSHPYQQPSYRSRTSRIFLLHTSKLQWIFIWNPANDTQEISRISLSTCIKFQTPPYTKNPCNRQSYRDFIYSICKIR